MTDSPKDWDVTIRPIIARLYEEAIIGNAYITYPLSLVFAATDFSKELNFCCDYHDVASHASLLSRIESSPTTHQLLRTTRMFSDMHGVA